MHGQRTRRLNEAGNGQLSSDNAQFTRACYEVSAKRIGLTACRDGQATSIRVGVIQTQGNLTGRQLQGIAQFSTEGARRLQNPAGSRDGQAQVGLLHADIETARRHQG